MMEWIVALLCVLVLVLFLGTRGAIKSLKEKITMMESGYGGVKHNHGDLENLKERIRETESGIRLGIRDPQAQWGYSFVPLKDVVSALMGHLNIEYARNPQAVVPPRSPEFVVRPIPEDKPKKKGKKNE